MRGFLKFLSGMFGASITPWGGSATIEAGGLLTRGETSGVVIGAWEGKPMIDTSMKPVAVLGAARSGKTTSVLVPSLLTWRQSAVVLDMNGELFGLTENWRRAEAHNEIRRICFAGESSPDSYNFLDTIRRGTSNELADIEALAASLVPMGGNDGQLTGHGRSLLTLCIIEKCPDPTAGLSDVYELLKLKRCDGPYACAFSYRDSALSTDLYQAAECLSYEFLKLPFDEATAALEMVCDALSPFACPEIAKNTKRSSFGIKELLGDGAPVTLYVTVNAWEIGLLWPLINAFLSQVARYAVHEKPQTDTSRLLLLLDNGGTSGHLDFLDEPLSRLSEHGVKPLFAIRSFRGDDTASRVWKQSKIRIVLRLNQHSTAEFIANEIRAGVDQRSGASAAEPTVVTADELMGMQQHDAVVLGVSESPICAGLRAYYEDPKFQARIGAATAH